MKRKNLLVNLSITAFFGIVFAILCGIFNVFEKLDFRLYDGLLKFTKDPPLNEQVMVLAITDDDINRIGEWPWSRDIIADTLIRLRELNAAASIFDIEYISKSTKTISSDAMKNVNKKIDETLGITEEIVQSFPTALNQGYTNEEIAELSDYLIYENLYPVYDDLSYFIQNNIAFDNDDYFGKAIQFFGNTYLTVNIIGLDYNNVSDDDVNYIRNNMLLSKIKQSKNYIQADNIINFEETYPDEKIGFTPALNSLIRHAKGVGYTNSNVDTDGIRRRNELFYEYDGKYLGQLAFGPLMDYIDARDFERTKHYLIIKDALFPGETERRDVKIPLDEHGQMYINYQHETSKESEENEKQIYGINYVGISNFIQLDNLEKNIANNTTTILDQSISTGDFPLLFDETGNPLNYYYDLCEIENRYNEILDIKNYLLNKCTGYEDNFVPVDLGEDEYGRPLNGITQDDYDYYYALRNEYYEFLKIVAQTDYKNEILTFLSENPNPAYENEDRLNLLFEYFDEIQNNITSYLDNLEYFKNELEGKFCIFGHTAASTTDIGANPFNKQYVNVLIHANIMNTLLTQNFITPLPWWIGFLTSLLISIILALLLSEKSSTIQNLVGGITRFVIIIVFVSFLPMFQIYIPIVGSVIFYVFFDYLAGVIYRYLRSSQERRFITEIASSFANKDTVAQLRENPDAFKTEGQKKCITALFSDIQKFSTLSESIGKIYGDEGPNKLIEILNEYLGSMSNEILKNNGNIDKYEGDAIISMFGAPDPLQTHTKEEWAYLCLDSALRMKKAEIEFNDTHKDLFKPVQITKENGETETIELKPLQTRIGINSGEAFVGLMGSKTENFSKLNYTMIGDTVNLASRLEGVNKVYNCWIMCSEDTWQMANTGEYKNKITVRRLDRVRVVGRSTPVQLYNVVGFTDELTQIQKDELELFNEAMDKYLSKDFTGAGKLFVKAAKLLPEGDATALVFADRCKNYIKKGVSDDWDGVMNMTSK